MELESYYKNDKKLYKIMTNISLWIEILEKLFIKYRNFINKNKKNF